MVTILNSRCKTRFGGYFMGQIEKYLTLKRTKLTIYMILVLWLAVFMQIIVNRLVKEEATLTEAFMGIHAKASESSLEMAGVYGENYLSEIDKKELVSYIASSIGLRIDDDVKVEEKDNLTVVSYEKSAKRADSTIRLISVRDLDGEDEKTTHYLYVKLSIFEDLDSIISYKDKLEELFKYLKTEQNQIVVEFVGEYNGNLPLEEKNKIANQLVKNLGGNIAYENRKDDLFTVYAYSGLIKEYITVAGSKVNMQVAMNYNEQEDATYVYLATPFLNDGY